MSAAALEHRIATVRRFNRFYTQKIGVLGERLLNSPFSLTEARVLYELALRDHATATELRRDLGLDPGYLSRILAGFRRRGLVSRASSEMDRRQSHLSLTQTGRAAFAPLDACSRDEIATLLASLPEPDQRRLVAAMEQAERLLDSSSPPKVPYLLRPPAAGDIGWVISRHGALYAQEYGFDQDFEALIAEIAAKFITELDRRTRGRTGRLGVSRQRLGADRQIAAAAGRAVGARPRNRRAARRRMHPLRAAIRL
jgi:DNA-binding MarR family transcriptional regulator